MIINAIPVNEILTNPQLASIVSRLRHPYDNNDEESTIISGQDIPDLASNGCFSIAYYIGQFLGFGILISMIVMGSVYLNDCPAQNLIPISLIVAGGFGILNTLITSIVRYFSETPENFLCLKCILVLLSLFLTAWFIAMCCWIYSLDFDHTATSGPKYCNMYLYNFTFWLQSAQLILLGVLFIGIPVCVCFCVCCCVPR